MQGKHRAGFAALLVAAFGTAAAQTTIYESRNKDGPVFSDRPTPGASAVDLPPPNVVSMPAPVPAAPAKAAAVAAPAYKSLVFVSMTEGATVHTNTGAFDFSIRAVPALRPGDRLRVQLDGRLLPQTYRGTNLNVTEADWRSAARSGSVEHRLQVTIVDGQGTVLISSDPINFFVHRATSGGPRN